MTEMRFPTMRLLVLALAGLIAACGPFFARGRADHNLITEEQIKDNHFRTAFDAVQALHSNWLNMRPNTLIGKQDSVLVYFDNVKLGYPRELRDIEVGRVTYIRYFDPVQATTRWGVGHSQGVIYVSSHPQDEGSN